MHPMVSIIVPVYNAEHALRQCIDSVLEQEYTDFELILVNDGSTDGSGAVCDEYARRDSRIQVIHKINTGVSDSRNMAISDNKTSRQLTITFLPAADPILKELHAVREEFEQARFAGLDEDEIIQYARLNAKIKQNILNIL